MNISGISALIAGCIAATLAAMGVGGGGLLVIYLTMVAGMGQKDAQGLNLIFFVCTALSSLPVHLRKRRIEWSVAVPFALGGCIGAYLGARLCRSVEPELLRSVFGWFLMLSALSALYSSVKGMILGRGKGKRNSQSP